MINESIAGDVRCTACSHVCWYAEWKWEEEKNPTPCAGKMNVWAEYESYTHFCDAHGSPEDYKSPEEPKP